MTLVIESIFMQDTMCTRCMLVRRARALGLLNLDALINSKID